MSVRTKRTSLNSEGVAADKGRIRFLIVLNRQADYLVSRQIFSMREKMALRKGSGYGKSRRGISNSAGEVALTHN